MYTAPAYRNRESAYHTLELPGQRTAPDAVRA